jgi:hypothetical protein
VSTTEELRRRKSSGCGLERQEYGLGDLWCWPCDTLYLQKLAQSSLTRFSRSVGIVRSQTKATEFSFSIFFWSPGSQHVAQNIRSSYSCACVDVKKHVEFSWCWSSSPLNLYYTWAMLYILQEEEIEYAWIFTCLLHESNCPCFQRHWQGCLFVAQRYGCGKCQLMNCMKTGAIFSGLLWIHARNWWGMCM